MKGILSLNQQFKKMIKNLNVDNFIEVKKILQNQQKRICVDCG